MSYIKKIEESKRKVYNQAVAQRILDLIDKLRLNSNENDERRWIWELMQNAKDVAFDNKPVSILIDFQTDIPSPKIEFKHNGKPFSIDNITFLIEQVSTKDRETPEGQKPKTTGKFGTGFLSTHLLSEIVELDGVVKEPGLPYKKFKLTLDRSGSQIEEIIVSVNESLHLLSSLDENETYLNYNESQYNTSFRYLLDESGSKTAAKGLEDLEVSLPFTLAFVPNINSVTVNSNVIYSMLPEIIAMDDGIDICTIQKEKDGDVIEIYIAVLATDRISIAVQVDYKFGQITLIGSNPKLPKLFCDFPLIGSEDFNSPVIISSSLFNPTEQRNGIFLSNKLDHKILENKKLLIEAKDLYFKLLTYAARHKWENLFVLAEIDLPKSKEWISREWMKEMIVEPIHRQLLIEPIIDTIRFGHIPILCGGYHSKIPYNAVVDFPKHTQKKILDRLWQLCNNQYFILPKESDYQYWAKIIWDEKYVITLLRIVQLIESKKNLLALSTALGKTNKETIEWLNEFYALLIEEGEIIRDIHSRSLYPNQNGIFKKKEELNSEIGDIPDQLKEIVKLLGDDVGDRLIDKFIQIELPRNNSLSTANIADSISNLIKSRFSLSKLTDESRRIFKLLYLWFIQNTMEAEKNFDDLFKNKHKLLDDNEIVLSIEKAELLDVFLKTEPNLSIERIQQLLEIEALSKGFNTDQNYTPDEHQKMINFENGWRGEAFVFKILKSRCLDVIWPNKSIKSTANRIIDFEGEEHFIDDKAQKYDLVIPFSNGKKSYVQVKSTTTDINRADEIAMPISTREWKFINEKAMDDTYYLARVFNVNSFPEVYFMKIESSI